MNQLNNGMKVSLEALSKDDEIAIEADLEIEKSHIAELFQAVNSIISKEEAPRVRLVITANFILSVSSRGSKKEEEYTVSRGSGVVVGKTMAPDEDGIVDILFPLQYVLSSTTDIVDIRHIAKHEAVHAHLHLMSVQPFQTVTRGEFAEARAVFLKLAGDLAEEYLAELMSVSRGEKKRWADKGSISDALSSMENTLLSKLAVIPEDSENYYGLLMTTTFNTFYILWKALAFLAVELVDDDISKPVLEELSGLRGWRDYVAPGWERYFEILRGIRSELEIDIDETDEIVKDLASHLQKWALQLGFDFHDTPDGHGWFQQVAAS